MQSPQIFTARGFDAYFPVLDPWVAWSVSLPSFLFPVYLQANVGPLGLPAGTLPNLVLELPPCHESYLPRLPISTLSTGLDECFFFNSFVVGLLCSSIFWLLWLFFIFKFIVLLLIVQGCKVYLPTPPSWLEVSLSLFFQIFNFLLFLFSFCHPYDVKIVIPEVVPEGAYPICILLNFFHLIVLIGCIMLPYVPNY